VAEHWALGKGLCAASAGQRHPVADGVAPVAQWLLASLSFLLGVVVAFRLVRRGLRKAIWRLRNRLIAAYIFIAVVPVC